MIDFKKNICLSSDGIVKTMRSKAGPASKELLTVADAEKFLSSMEYGVIGQYLVSVRTVSVLLSAVKL